MSEKLMTVPEVADALNVTPRWVYTQYEAGSLPGGKIGRYLRFRRSDIEKYVENAFRVRD